MSTPHQAAITTHRIRSGRSQQWLAKQLGVSVMEVDGLERGKIPLTPIQAQRIAKVFRILPYHLVGMCDCTAHYQEPVYANPPARR